MNCAFFKIILFSTLILFCGEISTKNIVKNITNMNGLSNNSVNCFHEDRHNILWVGTWDGLNAFNGRDFVTYRYSSSNEYSISNNIIRNIVEPDSTSLWIVTDQGLNRWDRLTGCFNRYFVEPNNDTHKGNNLLLIDVTSKGDIICYAQLFGFSIFNKGKNSFMKLDGLNIHDVHNFIIDSQDNIHILSNNGILYKYQINHTNGEYILCDTNTSVVPIKQIFYTNNMLIADCSEYLEIIGNKNEAYNKISLPSGKKVSQVVYSNDQLIISFYEGTCMKYDFYSRSLSNLEGLSEKVSVFTLYTGSQDILWIGTDGQGIIQLYEDYSPFNRVKTDFPVRCFHKDESGNILIGTKGEGILSLDSKNNKATDYLSTINGLISNLVYSMVKNKEGDIFVGTEEYGVNIIRRDGRVQLLTLPRQNPEFRAIYSMYLTNNDSILWLGTSGYGLIRIHLKKEKDIYTATDIKQFIPDRSNLSLTNNIIYSILGDKPYNELWIGTRRGGLYRFDTQKEKFTNLEDINPALILSSYDIITLYKNNQNSIWVGTSYGLDHIILDGDGSHIKKYGLDQGLANNTIHGIIEDDRNRIWVSTSLGIASIDLTSDNISNYSIRDGLHNNEFADGAYYYNNGTVFLGGVNGFTYFEPSNINFRNYNPEISLNRLRIYNIDQDIDERINNKTLKLSYNEPYASFTFVAHEFINNENCEYRYRILNLHNDNEWIYNDNNPNIIITKLPSGNYTLEVECTNGDRVWSGKVYSLNLDVAYPWWLSIWAFLAYVIILALIIKISISIVKNRIRLNRQLMIEQIESEHKQKIHESKLDFFTNVAHEFFTPLTLIYGPVQHLLDNVDLDSYTKRYIYIIKNNAERMQKLISELIEFRKAESTHSKLRPENVDLKVLIESIADSFQEMKEENKIKLTLNIQVQNSFITDYNALEKIIFNLVSNAFKYTPVGGYIKIDARQNQNTQFALSIRNTGKGLNNRQKREIFDRYKIFDTPQIKNSVSSGIGLNMTKQLVELLNGSITVEGVQGEYAQFNIELSALQVGRIKEQTERTDNYIENLTGAVDCKNISILIVDDEKDIRTLLYDILSPKYKVVEASNGEDALNIISKNIPDLILTDMLMPLLDGMELIDYLKSKEITAHIPIISITAKTSVEDKIDAYKHGADLYITKPFHPRHILSAIENIINRNTKLKKYFSSSESSITIKDGRSIHQDDEIWLKKLTHFIEKNIDDESLTFEVIADYMNISRTSLYRRLKELTEKTPSEFVKDIRLEYASLLLKTTKLTVTEVIFKSGFSNSSHFYREFMKKYGMSPKNMKNSN